MARGGGSLGPLDFGFTGVLAFMFFGLIAFVVGSSFGLQILSNLGLGVMFLGIWLYMLGRIRMPYIYRVILQLFGFLFLVLIIL